MRKISPQHAAMKARIMGYLAENEFFWLQDMRGFLSVVTLKIYAKNSDDIVFKGIIKSLKQEGLITGVGRRGAEWQYMSNIYKRK